jgi:hypothetical protein
MPTYHARGVSIRLGVMPLAETTTPSIVLKKGELAKQQCEEAEKRLLQSELLREESVRFPDDDAGFELNWLGGAPFMQARAGIGLFEDDLDGDPSPSVAAVKPASLRLRSAINSSHLSGFRHSKDPLALALHVKLSDKSFVSGLNTTNKVHLKIDVFFNGQLSSCMFVPVHDVRSGVKSLHQVFAGYRVDFLAERPWVILPPQKGADGSPSKHRIGTTTDQRWENICKALNKDANARGMDTDGNVPPSAEFLQALAAMPMPDEVKHIPKPGGRNFGVIDIIITAGDGRKVTTGTTYLKAPQRLVDENYPLRNGHDYKTGAMPTLGTSDVEEGVWDAIEASPDVVDVDAEDDGDSDYEPRAKRQAIAPNVLSTHPPSTKLTTVRSRKPFQDAAKSSIPVPVLNTSTRSSIRTIQKVSSSGSSSPPRKVCMDNTSSSPERGRTGHRGYVGEEDNGYPVANGALYGTPQSLYSFPSSNISLARTPQMRPSPYSIHFSDPVLAQASPGNLMDLTSFNDLRNFSSPLQHNLMNPYRATPYHQRPRPHIGEGVEFSHGPQNSRSGVASMAWPELPRRDSLSSTQNPSFSPAAPWSLSSSGPAMQPPAGSARSGLVSNILPVQASFGGYGSLGFNGVSHFLPHDRRLSMALPPTGMYTVPTKPKSSRSSRSSLSPLNKYKRKEHDTPRSTFLMKRLVITGKDGATLVDRQWSTAQMIAKSYNEPTRYCKPTSTSVKTSRGSSETSRISKPHIGPRRSSRSTVKMATPPTKLPPQHGDGPTEGKNSAQEPQSVCDEPESVPITLAISTSAGRLHGLRENGNIKKDPGVPSQLTAAATRVATRLAMPQRCTPSGTNILGVQGTKATPFWLEDPEEIMREAARLRRSRSPAKRNTAPSAGSTLSNAIPKETAMKVRARTTSSPLSSLATTPEPEVNHYVSMVHTTTDSLIPTTVGKVIAQLDGSPDRESALGSSPKKPISSTLKKCTPSQTKLVPPTRFPAKPPSPAKSSPSPNTKKRKAAQRYLVKQPRSPDRLKTVSNPPLNLDCVIAFAESEDKNAETGVLRQVRGERQGVFREECVVLATRFYVGGI